MAATGRFVAAEVHPAPLALALAAAGATMAAVLGLAVLALDVAGIRGLIVRAIRSGAPRPRREPLGREETGPA